MLVTALHHFALNNDVDSHSHCSASSALSLDTQPPRLKKQDLCTGTGSQLLTVSPTLPENEKRGQAQSSGCGDVVSTHFKLRQRDKTKHPFWLKDASSLLLLLAALVLSLPLLIGKVSSNESGRRCNSEGVAIQHNK